MNPAGGSNPKSFRAVFCPSYKWDSYQGMLGSFTVDFGDGLGARDGWKSYAVAVICQGILRVTSHVKQRVDDAKVRSALDRLRPQVDRIAFLAYGGILAASEPKSSGAHQRLRQDADLRSACANLYSQILLSKEWIEAQKAKLASHTWTNAAWEMFHHWIKLAYLGCDDSRLDELVRQVQARLPLPSEVQADRWRSYRSWFPGDIPDFGALEGEMTPGLLRDRASITPRSYLTLPEDWSRQFLYRYASGFLLPQGSCFAAGSRVALAEGGTLSIEELRPGDRVATSGGPRSVAVVADFPRSGRPLYSLNGLPFFFSASHPLVNAERKDTAPEFLCISPALLRSVVPSLQRSGIAALETGSLLLARSGDRVNPLRVTALEEHRAAGSAEDSERLYDLILEPDSEGAVHWYAGSESLQIAVASELPMATEAPLAVRAALVALERLGAARSEWESLSNLVPELRAAGDFLAPGLVALALERLARTEPASQASGAQIAASAARLAEADIDLRAEVVSRMAWAHSRDGRYDGGLGLVFGAFLSHCGSELETLTSMPWRILPDRVPPEDGVLALGFSQLHLDPPVAAEIEGPVSLRVRLAGGDPAAVWRVEESSERAQTRFTRRLDSVLYVPLPASAVAGEGLLEIEISLGAPSGAATRFGPVTALCRVPTPLRSPYRRCEPTLFTADGRTAGTVGFDLRALDRRQAEEERLARETCTTEESLRFAVVLGDALGEALVQRFSAVIENLTLA